MVESSLVAPRTLLTDSTYGTATLEMLHRTRVEDAFLQQWRRTGDTFVVAGRWPAHHAFFAPVADGRVDPLLVAETLRQSVHLVVHAGFGLPVGHASILQNMRFTCLADRLAVAGEATDVDVLVSIPGYENKGRRTAMMRAELEILCGGVTVAHAEFDFQTISPAVYRRLRAGRTEPVRVRPMTEGIPAAAAGRARAEDVLLSATPQELSWHLRVDTEHGTLFQSAKDHVPGMLLLEAARQAAHAACAPDTFVPWVLDASFHSYVEFGEACWIQAHELTDTALGERVVRVTGHQDNRLAFQATLRDPRVSADRVDARGRR
ncbi:MAG: adhesin [Streptomyces sp.]|jgi:hypothetical protein|nr:adhesin [Streptomyces sp.]